MRLKKNLSNLKKCECVVLTFVVLTFLKARFFLLPEWQKVKRMNKKRRRTSSTSLLLGFCFSFQNGFVHTKKKQFVCWKLCFLVNEERKEKKTLLFVHETTSGLLVSEKKSKCWTSVVLRLFLKERQRQSKHFVFFLLTLLCCPKKKKKVFFEVVFCFVCFIESLFLRRKTFGNQTC